MNREHVHRHVRDVHVEHVFPATTLKDALVALSRMANIYTIELTPRTGKEKGRILVKE
jgi:hypothetical protein